jgi:alpha-L-fucosidase
MTPERAKPLHELLALKPDINTTPRLGGGYRGDTETPEQHIPATGYKDRDWETCMTMNGTWGFKSYDDNWKSTETLIRNLADIISKGGNYLLNVGPTAEGEIPQPSIDRLKEVGAWMKVNGEAVYGTQASPFRSLPWGRCSRKVAAGAMTLYLHVFDWPADGKLVVPGLKNDVEKAWLLADPSKSLAVSRADEDVAIAVPARAPDKIDSVVALRVKGEVETAPYVALPEKDGAILLKPAFATCNGSIKAQGSGKTENLGFWTNPEDTAEWRIKIAQAGAYKVSTEVAALGPTKFALIVGGRRLVIDVPKTGDYDKFQAIQPGTLELEAGAQTARIEAIQANWRAANVTAIRLSPAK